jgi:transposase
VFSAIVYVLTSGCAWRDVPPSLGVPFQTAHRHFSQWTKVGLWRRVHHAMLDERGGAFEFEGQAGQKANLGAGRLAQHVRQAVSVPGTPCPPMIMIRARPGTSASTPGALSRDESVHRQITSRTLVASAAPVERSLRTKLLTTVVRGAPQVTR